MNLPGVVQVLHLEVADSTHTVARFLAEQGAPHGTLVWADRQTAGRGRLERKWDSGPGGLYVSLILRPDFPPSRLAALSLDAARAAAAAIRKLTGLEAYVKPPNDVYVNGKGAAKKVCGILAEASGNSRKVDWVVLGIGVNVNNRPQAPQATSLKSLTGKAWGLETTLRNLLKELPLPAVGDDKYGIPWLSHGDCQRL